MTTVSSSRIPLGIQNALNAKLKNAVQAIQQGDNATACGDLQDFINQVNAQRGKKIADVLADSLVTAVSQIQTELGCGGVAIGPTFLERLTLPWSWMTTLFGGNPDP